MSRLAQHDSEWGYLMKLQSDRIKQEELLIRQQEEERRRHYKEQLEEMIANNNSRNRHNREEDVTLMKLINRNNQQIEESEREQQTRLHKIKTDFAKQNLMTKDDHIRKQVDSLIIKIEDRLRENKTFQETYRRQQQAAQKEQLLEIQLKKRQKTELANAYEQKIHENVFSRQRIKEEDMQYSEQNYLLELNKDRQRKELLDKIKYGYQQNPQTFNTYADLLKKKEEDKQIVISKYLKEEGYESPQKSPDIKEHSSRPQNHLAQIEQELEHLRNKRMNGHLTHQQIDRIREMEKKLQFRKMLQHQIDQRQQQRMNEKKMDNIEARINKQAFTGQLMLPGLSTNDYQKVRQRMILNNSMGVRNRLRTLEEIRPSQGYH